MRQRCKEASPLLVQMARYAPGHTLFLHDHQDRVRAIKQIHRQAAENRLASQQMAAKGLSLYHPDMEVDDLMGLNNQVLLMIAEYHLTSACQGTHSVTAVLPREAAQLLPPVPHLQGDRR